MTSQEVLLKCLQCAEEAINNVYPYAVADIEAENKVKEKTIILDNAKNSVASTKKVLKISLVVSVIAFIFGQIEEVFGILAALFQIISGLAIFVLVCSIIVGVSQIVSKSVEKSEKDLLQAQNYAAQVKNALTQKRNENKEGLGFYTNMMPRDCSMPENARLFVSFFETGRAQTLGDAVGLYDEYKHREKMEALANQQIAASNAAVNAAMYAAEQSINAMNAANRATNAANRASMNSMYNNK